MNRRLAWVGLSGVAIAALTSTLIAPVAGASTVNGTVIESASLTRDQQRIVNQNDLHSFLDTYFTGDEAARAAIPGYAGIVLDVDRRTVYLNWNGPLSQSLQDWVSTAPVGVTVVVQAVPLSAASEIAARDAMLAAINHNGHWEINGATVDSVAILPDGSGLQVSYQPASATSSAATMKSKASSASASQVSALLSGLAGVPVSVALGAPVASTSRQSDTSPWYGGAAVHAPVTGYYCSSSFSVTGVSDYADRMITGAHCTWDGTSDASAGTWTTWGTPTGTIIGDTKELSTKWDALAIKVTKGYNVGRVWDGPFNTTTQSQGVTGSATNNVGDYVCADGANSGAHCNILIDNDNTSLTVNIYRMYSLITGSAPSGSIAVAGGDSGGPVFSSTDYTKPGRIAKGVIVAGVFTKTCPATEVGTTCYTRLFYSPIRPILAAFNVTLKTG